jgi:hypothetical protein
MDRIGWPALDEFCAKPDGRSDDMIDELDLGVGLHERVDGYKTRCTVPVLIPIRSKSVQLGFDSERSLVILYRTQMDSPTASEVSERA